MDRRSWTIDGTELQVWLQALVDQENTVVAPVSEDGVLLFRPIRTAEQAVIEGSGKTRWSPKEFLFPRSEALYRYRFEGDRVQLEDPPPVDKPQILFGVRSCDASGLVRLDEIFLRGTKDPLYAARRESTIVVSVACAAAEEECFCTAVGGSPVGEEGSDLQLVPIDDHWIVKAVTERGGELVADLAEGWSEAAAGDLKHIEKTEEHVAGQIECNPVNAQWSKVLEDGFEHPAWAQLAEHCLGCSICAYVCPSCSCFDMNHEANAWCGEQCRSWDACTFALFTHHASGHNPRSTAQERYRQRVLHKFAFKDGDEERFRCVGCGRCVALCPAGLDIVDTVTSAVAAIREEGADAAR
jgi:Pyruvate/2-oxoacid:ferredoxin oxidoreductase delta subunit